MAKFQVSSYSWAWPSTSINPRVASVTYNTVSSFFNMPSYSFFTGVNGYGLNTNAVNAFANLPYWTAYVLLWPH